MQQDKRFSDYSARAVRLENQTDDDEIEIDFRAIASTLWRHKWMIVISIFVGGLLAFLVTTQMQPKYRATATMLFNTATPNIVELGLDVTGGQFTDTLQEEIETLQSTTLLGRVVDVLRLENDPKFNPKLIEEEPNLFQRFFGALSAPSEFMEIGQNLGLAAPTNPDIISPDPIELAEIERLSVIRNVASGLSLQPVQRSDVLRVSYTSDDARLSARIANAVAEQYIEDQLQANLDATRAATEWISERVEELRIRVQQAEEAVEAAWATQSAQSGRSLESIEQQQAALNTALVAAQEQAGLLQSQYRELRYALDTDADIRAYTAFRASPFIEGYMTTQEELLARRDELTTTVPETHSAIIRLDSRIETIQSRIVAEAERITNAARSDWLAARNSMGALEDQLRELQNEALAQAQQSVSIRQLEREAQASRLLFENFLAREKETSTQVELQSADARVLSPAEIPLAPISSAARRTLALGLILGAAVGVGLVFLLEKLNNAFRYPNQLEDMTGEAVLAMLPSIGRKIKGADVLKKFRDSPKSSLAEAVRNLRTSVLFSNANTSPQVILFTSSVPSEGKSTTATLMAMTSRQMGKSAIIVDCDLRLPALERIFAPENKKKPGLFSFLKGEASLDDAIYVDPETDLHVLMPRDYEPRWDLNPADVLSSKLFEALIEALRKKYDRVILDLPPTLVVSDARIAAAHADAVVYMVRWDHTPRGAVIEGLNELRAVQAPLAGVALGQVDETRASRYSYGGISYYRGRYRSYYVN